MATERVTLTVKGMHCSACVQRIERALGKLDGVTAVKVNLVKGLAEVEYTPGQATVGQLQATVRDLGFQVPN